MSISPMQLSLTTMNPRLGGGPPPNSFPHPSQPHPRSILPTPSPSTSLFPFPPVAPNRPFGAAPPFHPPPVSTLPFPGFPAPSSFQNGPFASPLSSLTPAAWNPAAAAAATPSSLLQNSAAAQQTAMLLARLEHHKAEMERIHHGLLQIEYRGENTFTSQATSGSGFTTSLGRSVSPQSQKKRAISGEAERPTKALRIDAAAKATDDSDGKNGNLRGERRLVISFENFGTPGQYPQTFGKSGAIIPDGISGTHTVYNERWKFQINHSPNMFEVDYSIKCVPLTWSIANLTTGVVTSVTETRDETIIRNTQGQTISNKVFREALESRARDLEATLAKETNPRRAAQLQSLIRALRPKRFSEGPLIFGLQHRIIQEKMTAMANKEEKDV